MKNSTLAIISTPPPIHGSNVINAAVREIVIAKEGVVLDYNFVQNIDEIGRFEFRKYRLFFIKLVRLIVLLASKNFTTVYFPVVTASRVFWRDALVLVILKLFCMPRIIVHIHGAGILELRKRYGNLIKIIFRDTEIIVLTKEMLKDFSFHDGKKHIIPNGLKDNVGRHMNKSTDSLVLSFLSNFHRDKGVLEFLEISKEIIRLNPDLEICLNVIGQDTSEITSMDVKAYADRLGILDRITELGPRFGEEKYRILKNTTFLIFPTRYSKETFGLVLIEAFMTSTPVISTYHNGIPSVVGNDRCGLLFKIGTPVQDIALEVTKVYNMNYAEFTVNARKRYENNFTDEIFKRKMIDLLYNQNKNQPA